VRCTAPRAVDGDGDSARGADVVLLDQDAAGEVVAVIGTAADAHGMALELAHSRCRLAGVGDPDGVPQRLLECARLRGDATHPLEQVQPEALGPQQGDGRSFECSEIRARLDRRAIGDIEADTAGARRRPGQRRHAVEDVGEDVGASEHERGLGDQAPATALAAVEERSRRHVAARQIFFQRQVDEPLHVR